MKIKIVGTGSKGNCYILEANKDEKLILECGVAWKDIIFNLDFNLDGVKGCLISHAHKDHCKDVEHLLHNAIDVYCNKDVAIKNNLESRRKVHIVKNKNNFKIGNFEIMVFELEHTNADGTKCDNLGYLIYHKEFGKILFATDTYYCKYTFSNVDHILIECNYAEEEIKNLEPYRARILKSHMSLETLKKTLKTWDLKDTIDITLIHLSENNSNEKLMKKEIEKITGIPVYIAKKGQVIESLRR